MTEIISLHDGMCVCRQRYEADKAAGVGCWLYFAWDGENVVSIPKPDPAVLHLPNPMNFEDWVKSGSHLGLVVNFPGTTAIEPKVVFRGTTEIRYWSGGGEGSVGTLQLPTEA